MNLHLDKYSCKICNKTYSSASSLWNHNSKFHNNTVSQSSHKLDNKKNHNVVIEPTPPKIVGHDVVLPVSSSKNSNMCSYCKKIFQNRSNRWRHEKKCQSKKNILDENIKLKKEIEELKHKPLLDTLYTLVQQPPVPVNQQTLQQQITTNNTNSHNTTNNNNGIINNIIINAFGKETLDKLTPNEIKKLIKNNNPLIDIIGLLNFNEKYPENHSFCNTSLEGNYVSVLNTDKNKIEKINKNEFYDKVLNNSFEKIDQLSLMLELDDGFKETLKDKYKKHLDKKIDHLKDNFFTDKVYKNCYKKNINQISYNKKDIVLDTWSKLTDNYDDNVSVSTLETNDSLMSDSE